MNPPTTTAPVFKPGGLVQTLAIFFIALSCIATSVISFLPMDDASMEDLDHALLVGGVGIAAIFVAVAAAITYLVWLYRVHGNLLALGASGVKYSSGWVIGAWFVPIMCLWRPYQIVREVWNGSDPDTEGSPEAWRTRAPVAMLVWWTAWVASAVLSQITMRLDVLSVPVATAEVTLTLISGITCVMVMREIDQRQRDRWARLSAGHSHALRDQLSHAPDRTRA